MFRCHRCHHELIENGKPFKPDWAVRLLMFLGLAEEIYCNACNELRKAYGIN